MKSSKNKSPKKGIRKKTIPNIFKIGPVTFIVVAVAITAFIGFLFLAQLFQSSTKGYEISALRNNVEELKEENKKLEIQAAELRSFGNIEKSIEDLNMVRADNVVYLKKAGSTIVANR